MKSSTFYQDPTLLHPWHLFSKSNFPKVECQRKPKDIGSCSPLCKATDRATKNQAVGSCWMD